MRLGIGANSTDLLSKDSDSARVGPKMQAGRLFPRYNPRLPISGYPSTKRRLLDRCPVEVAEAPAECDEILVGELLSANQEHQVIEPGPVDGQKICAADGSRPPWIPLQEPRQSVLSSSRSTVLTDE